MWRHDNTLDPRKHAADRQREREKLTLATPISPLVLMASDDMPHPSNLLSKAGAGRRVSHKVVTLLRTATALCSGMVPTGTQLREDPKTTDHRLPRIFLPYMSSINSRSSEATGKRSNQATSSKDALCVHQPEHDILRVHAIAKNWSTVHQGERDQNGDHELQ